jgi:hypothetical protein
MYSTRVQGISHPTGGELTHTHTRSESKTHTHTLSTISNTWADKSQTKTVIDLRSTGIKLTRARGQWANIARPIVTEMPLSLRACSGMFYRAIAQAVLLYACETWVITDSMLQNLKGLHNRVAHSITKMKPYTTHLLIKAPWTKPNYILWTEMQKYHGRLHCNPSHTYLM